jgi:hypothetical protein
MFATFFKVSAFSKVSPRFNYIDTAIAWTAPVVGPAVDSNLGDTPHRLEIGYT